MSAVLSEYLNKKVSVITTDGSLYIGILEGYDHSTNLALRKAVRLIIAENGSHEEIKGLFVIRGDCVSTVGRVSPKLERRINWKDLTGKPLNRFR